MITQRSVVKWFDAKKGYGFIVNPQGGQDIFVHYSQIETDQRFKTLRTGQVVEYQLHDGPKGPHAINVSFMEEQYETHGPQALVNAAPPSANPPKPQSTLCSPHSSRPGIQTRCFSTTQHLSCQPIPRLLRDGLDRYAARLKGVHAFLHE